MITKKQRKQLIDEQKELTIAVINVISKAALPVERRMHLVSFMSLISDIIDLEDEKLDYEVLVCNSNSLS